jgi:capsular exopolysaccharide synthesis family protein
MANTFRMLEEAQRKDTKKPRSLPAKVAKKRKMAVGSYVAGPWAEEYKRLQKNIASFLPDVNPRILLFAGISDGEGTETIVSRFGLVLAALGEKVLLIDAQMREPILHQFFAIDQIPGTTELLSGTLTLTEVMRRTPLDGLLVIPGGSAVATPFFAHELDTLYDTIDVMKAFADWIVFSCPPINTYNDAVALSGMADGVVLVVQAEKTRWEVAQSAKDRLLKAGANILGVVINDRRHHIPGWLYKRL